MSATQAFLTVESAPSPLPRVTIKFCMQCKWMLRAAYYAQELLSTFSTSLGEVALQPTTGGVFVIQVEHDEPSSSSSSSSAPAGGTPRRQQQQQQTHILWDRKTDGGFPETKELKRRLRDVVEPGRDLGHVDRDHHHRPDPAAPHAPAQSPKPTPAASEADMTATTPTATTTTTTTDLPPLPASARADAPASGGAGYGGDDEGYRRGLGGVMPLAPKPPADLTAAVQFRIDQSNIGGPVVSEPRMGPDEGQGQVRGEAKPAKCEDCE